MGQRVRNHDWAATALGGIHGWPAELRSTIAFVLESRFPAVFVAKQGLVTIYNDAFLPILRGKQDVLGRSFEETWAEIWPEVGPLVDRALAGESTFTVDMPLVIVRDGAPEQAYFTFSYSPVRDGQGRVIGFIDIVIETSQRVIAQRKVEAAEARQRFLLRLSDALRSLSGVEAMHEAATQMLAMQIDVPSARLEPQRDTGDATPRLAALRSGHPFASAAALEVPVRKQETLVASLLVDTAGPRDWTPDELTLIAEVAERTWDAVERARSRGALRESMARNAEILESISDAFYAVDRDWRFTYVNRRAEQWWGRDREGLIGKVYAEEFPEAVGTEPYQAHLVAAAERRRVQLEAVSPILGKWVDITIYPTADGGLSVYFRDIEEKKQAEKRQQLLLAELQHRVRNILAVTRAIIRRSNDGQRSTEDYAQHLEGRISALARTQVLLTRSAGAGADLECILRDELLAQAASERQFALEGPPVALSPKAAEVVTLALHELTTNAVKYGAFARDDGHLTILWHVEPRDDRDWLVLFWREAGVRVIDAAPRRRGFGQELIARQIPYELGGEGQFELKPGGLECRIAFPLRPGDSILQTDGLLP